MRPTATPLAAALACCLWVLPQGAPAQRPGQMREPSALTERILAEDRHLVSAQLGLGWLGVIRANDAETTLTINDVEREYTADLSGTAAVSAAYDYRLNRVLSIGCVASYQRTTLDDLRGEERLGPRARIHLNRTLLGTRLLFHYGYAEKVELYSGLRLGITVWDVSFRDFVDDVDLVDGVGAVGVTPQFTLIPFGLRGYLTDELSLGVEGRRRLPPHPRGAVGVPVLAEAQTPTPSIFAAP